MFEPVPQQIGLHEAFENARKKTSDEEEKKEKLLNAQKKFAAMVAHHNIPSSFNTCFSDFVSELFPDRETKWTTISNLPELQSFNMMNLLTL